MTTTDQDARALTYLARRLREETHGCREWDEIGTWAKVRELIGQNLALSMERVMCHATDPEAKTPGAILRPFVPAKPSERDPEPFRNPKADEACKTCNGWGCAPSRCSRERAVTEEPPSPLLPPVTDVSPRLADRLAKYTTKGD